MKFDHLEEIKRIIVLLNAEGKAEFAKKVGDAMRSASTGTELLMGVKFYLSQIPSNAISVSTMNQIQYVITEINKILG